MVRPFLELRLIDLQSSDLLRSALVRLQTHHIILATHYILFYSCFPKMSLMQIEFEL